MVAAPKEAGSGKLGRMRLPRKRLQCSIWTLVLRARSETIGYAYGRAKAPNSKHEIRNPNQCQNNNDRNL